MKLKRIAQVPELVVRYMKIFSVMTRYGLADWLDRTRLKSAKRFFSRHYEGQLIKRTPEERFTRALTELGPLFIKCGQILSGRPDIVGMKLAENLKQLQDQAPSDPPEVVKKTLEQTFCQPVEAIFQSIDLVPFASASIAQVHMAQLHSGEKVAVKIQHPNVRKLLETDLTILEEIAAFLYNHVPESHPYNPRMVVEELRRDLLRQLDFTREMHNMSVFRKNFKDNLDVRIPKPYKDFTKSNVLTMEFISGVKANDLDGIRALHLDPEEISITGAQAFLQMIFEHGVFHSDPHPGNIIIMKNGRIGFLDFGLVGRLHQDLMEKLEQILFGIARKEPHRLTRALLKLGIVESNIDKAAFERDIAEFTSYYAEIPIGEVSLGTAVRELLDIVQKHRIVLPANMARLLSTIIILESTGRYLSPSFDLMTLLRPYQKKLFRKQLSPKRVAKRFQRLLEESVDLLEEAPELFSDTLNRINDGRMSLELKMPKLDEFEVQLERSTNRLTFGILTASMFLASSLLMTAETPPTIGDYSILGILGYGISFFFSLRLIWAIFRSGNLN